MLSARLPRREEAEEWLDLDLATKAHGPPKASPHQLPGSSFQRPTTEGFLPLKWAVACSH